MKEIKADKKDNVLKLLSSFGVTIGAGIVAWLFSLNSKQIYGALKKPLFSPPPWLFGIVWGILYPLIGLAFYIILKKGTKDPKVKNARFYFLVQLFFNILWSVLFFTLQMRVAALADIIILLIYIIIATAKFFKIDKTAGILMLPYLAWVSFAVILNFAIVMLNN